MGGRVHGWACRSMPGTRMHAQEGGCGRGGACSARCSPQDLGGDQAPCVKHAHVGGQLQQAVRNHGRGQQARNAQPPQAIQCLHAQADAARGLRWGITKGASPKGRSRRNAVFLECTGDQNAKSVPFAAYDHMAVCMSGRTHVCVRVRMCTCALVMVLLGRAR